MSAPFFTLKEFYVAEYARLYFGSEREGNKRDNILLVISAGSVTLSVPAVLNIAESVSIIFVKFMIFGWIFLAFSLFLMVLNYFFVLEGFKCRFVELEKLKNGEANTYGKKTNVWQKLVEPINRISFALVVLGVGCLLWFFYQNIVNIKNMKILSNDEKALSDNQPQYIASTPQTLESNKPKPEIAQPKPVNQEPKK